MYWSLMKKVQVGFGAALLILTFIRVTSYRAEGDSIEAARSVTQTHETIGMLATLR
jgi:CHASE3 domain sensor protein